MKNLLSFLVLLTLLNVGCAQSKTEKQIGACEDCQMMFDGMPASLSWKTTIAPEQEPGESLTISGTIFQRDGKTPAEGVILYVYHTDNAGLYSKGAHQQHAVRHGHLRGWMKTDKQGRYEFKTIRPASYPNSKNSQHIHPILHEPGKGYYWIDEFVFDDDPLLTPQERNRVEKRGGSGVMKLKKNAQGVWEGKRDIVLGLNVPNY